MKEGKNKKTYIKTECKKANKRRYIKRCKQEDINNE